MWKGFHPKTNLTRHKKVHLNGKFTCFEHFGSEISLEEHASKVHSTSVNQPTKFFVRPVERSLVQEGAWSETKKFTRINQIINLHRCSLIDPISGKYLMNSRYLNNDHVSIK